MCSLWKVLRTILHVVPQFAAHILLEKVSLTGLEHVQLARMAVQQWTPVFTCLYLPSTKVTSTFHHGQLFDFLSFLCHPFLNINSGD